MVYINILKKTIYKTNKQITKIFNFAFSCKPITDFTCVVNFYIRQQ